MRELFQKAWADPRAFSPLGAEAANWSMWLTGLIARSALGLRPAFLAEAGGAYGKPGVGLNTSPPNGWAAEQPRLPIGELAEIQWLCAGELPFKQQSGRAETFGSRMRNLFIFSMG